VSNWRADDWLILRPLLGVAIVWATVVVALVAAWICNLIAARRRLEVPHQLVPAGRQVVRPGLDSGSPPPCSSTHDGESRAA